VEATFLGMLSIAAVTMLIYFIPSVGLFLAPIAMYFLLKKWTSVEHKFDAVVLVIVAWIGMFGTAWLFLRMFA
jgi:hypothetical protein